MKGYELTKVSAGRYRLSGYAIERQPSDYWWVTLDGTLLKQCNTLREAESWVRRAWEP